MVGIAWIAGMDGVLDGWVGSWLVVGWMGG